MMNEFSGVGRNIRKFNGGSNTFAAVVGESVETPKLDSEAPIQEEEMETPTPTTEPATAVNSDATVESPVSASSAVEEAQELIRQAAQQPVMESAAPAMEREPKAEDALDGGYTLLNASDVPCFTVVDVDDETTSAFAKEFSTSIHSVECIAEKNMLLDYMVRLERTYGVTMPFSACGVDTIVFDESAVQAGEGGPTVVELAIGEGDKKHSAFYEKIIVDGVVYLSCISESLNENYMYRVLSQATEAIYTNGKFVFTLVGPKYLGALGDDNKTPKFLDTLNLNSFELSVLNRHMGNLEGVTITYGTYNGKTAVMYRRG